MKPHPKIRKTVKWGGAVVCVLVLAAWIESGWWLHFWVADNGFGVYMGSGGAGFGMYPGWPGTGLVNLQIGHELQPWLEWSPTWSTAPGAWNVWVPHWIPWLMTLAATALAWRLDTLARRRAMTHLCPKCRYDRTGLAPGTVCPECGAAAPPSLPFAASGSPSPPSR